MCAQRYPNIYLALLGKMLPFEFERKRRQRCRQRGAYYQRAGGLLFVAGRYRAPAIVAHNGGSAADRIPAARAPRAARAGAGATGRKRRRFR